MYQWRKLTSPERAEVLAARRREETAWHGPPHWNHDGPARFHITAACYEHEPHIGRDARRMNSFADALLETVSPNDARIAAWCILPNHYHVLLETAGLPRLTRELGRLHGRSARDWNLQDHSVGRKVFYRMADRRIRSERHYWATINYIHHNPVHHRYVEDWTAWPWSSAAQYLSDVGRAEALRVWKAYPLLDYGAGWDEPDT
jgi:putative transposase